MKKKTLFGLSALAIVALLTFNVSLSNNGADFGNISLKDITSIAMANGEGTGYSCTATTNCSGGVTSGSVSCTGTVKCERGHDGWTGWVKCDGKKTSC